MNRLIIISFSLVITFSLAFGIYFFLKTQAVYQQNALLNAAPNHVVNTFLMNQIASDFQHKLDIWEAVLLLSSVILMIVLNYVFRPKGKN